MTPEEEREARLITPKIYASKKFRKSMKNLALFVLDELRAAHPDWSLNKLLAAIFQDCSPDLPASLLLEMTEAIVAEWEKMAKLEAVAA